jgi:hypothetical protein
MRLRLPFPARSRLPGGHLSYQLNTTKNGVPGGGGSTRKYSVNNVTIPGPDLATANYLETLYTVKVH